MDNSYNPRMTICSNECCSNHYVEVTVQIERLFLPTLFILLLIVGGCSAATIKSDETKWYDSIIEAPNHVIKKENYKLDHRAFVVAHRGANQWAPENTLAAFNAALQVHVQFIEFDVRFTKDNQPVIMHDSTLDRTTNSTAILGHSTLNVSDVSLDEIESLDAGSWFSPKFSGEKVPTLQDTLHTILGDSMALLHVKAGTLKDWLALGHLHNFDEQIYFMHDDVNLLQAMKKEFPSLNVVVIGSGALPVEIIPTWKAAQIDAISWEYHALNKDILKAIRANGMMSFAWTMDNKNQIDELANMGIDSIITNDLVDVCTPDCSNGY